MTFSYMITDHILKIIILIDCYFEKMIYLIDRQSGREGGGKRVIERERERERIFYLLIYSLSRFKDGSGLGGSWESGTPSGSPTWETETQALGPSWLLS